MPSSCHGKFQRLTSGSGDHSLRTVARCQSNVTAEKPGRLVGGSRHDDLRMMENYHQIHAYGTETLAMGDVSLIEN